MRRRNEPGRAVQAAAAALALVAPLASFAGVGATVNDVCRTSSDAAFRAKYCQAAKDNQKGYVANKSTSAIWGGVSVVCFAACAKVAIPAGEICKYSQMAGSALDGAISKKFVDSVLGNAGNATDALRKKDPDAAVSTDSLPRSEGGTRFDGSSCVTAAQTAKQSFDKGADAKKNVDGLNQLRDQTQSMNTLPKEGTPSFEGAASAGTNRAAATDDGAGACDETALKSALGSIRCAAQNDPSLPAYVKSESFLRDLAKASGQSPDEFFAGFRSPTDALLSSLAAAGISDESKAGMAEALAAMEKRAHSRVAAMDGEGYRAGGARSAEKAGDDFDVNGAIAGLLGQAGESGKRNEPDSGVDTVAIGARSPAGAAVDPEDRTISLFDRVKWRYGAVSARDHLGGLPPGGGVR